jgi:hypothetical protein
MLIVWEAFLFFALIEFGSWYPWEHYIVVKQRGTTLPYTHNLLYSFSLLILKLGNAPGTLCFPPAPGASHMTWNNRNKRPRGQEWRKTPIRNESQFFNASKKLQTSIYNAHRMSTAGTVRPAFLYDARVSSSVFAECNKLPECIQRRATRDYKIKRCNPASGAWIEASPALQWQHEFIARAEYSSQYKITVYIL